MRYTTVVFDLYGTLVEGFPMSAHERLVAEMAVILQAPDPEEFARRFTHEGWLDRATGRVPTMYANIERVFLDMGWPVQPDRIMRTVQLRREFTARTLAPLPGAVETVAAIRARGYRIGLISDCSEETPLLWGQTPFAPLVEVPIFSCEVGYLKPDPRIYAAACARLAVSPAECVYVGDRDDELFGARDAGMRAIQSVPPHTDTYESHQPKRVVWDGPVIPSVAALPAFLDTLQQ